MIIKRFGVMLFIVVAFMLAFASTHSVWGKAHVPLGDVQVCHNASARTVGQDSMQRHLNHGDCRLPACDFGNNFSIGDSCIQDNAGGFCSLANAVNLATTPTCVSLY